jgi:hypothetical protein
MPSQSNRRLHPRHAVGLECKLRRPSVPRYDSARTGDVSAGGAMLEVRAARPIAVGETLDVAVNWADRPLLAAGDLVRARVVRVGPVLDRVQRVAVAFDRPQHAADALAPSEAA